MDKIEQHYVGMVQQEYDNNKYYTVSFRYYINIGK